MAMDTQSVIDWLVREAADEGVPIVITALEATDGQGAVIGPAVTAFANLSGMVDAARAILEAVIRDDLRNPTACPGCRAAIARAREGLATLSRPAAAAPTHLH